MQGKAKLNEVIIETKIPELDLAPAKHHLVHATKPRYKSKKEAHILQKAIQSVKSNYDYVLVDLPPSNGHFIVNGVIAADSVILVLDPSQFSLDGVENFSKVFDSYCAGFNHKPKISMALVTRCKGSLNPFKKNEGKYIGKETEKIIGKDVHLIPYSAQIFEAYEQKLPISHYLPGSKVGKAYLRVTEQIIK